jgi:hypothetical protein
MQPSAVSMHREQHISNQNYEIKVVAGDSYFQIRTIVISCNQILIFEDQLCMSNMEFIFDTDQAQIYSVSSLQATLHNPSPSLTRHSASSPSVQTIPPFFTPSPPLSSTLLHPISLYLIHSAPFPLPSTMPPSFTPS